MTYRTAHPPSAPILRRRWVIRGWPHTLLLITPTLTMAVMRVVAQGWSVPARVLCAAALVGLVAWVAVFVRRPLTPTPRS